MNTCLLCEILKILIGNMLNWWRKVPVFTLFSCISYLEWSEDLTFLYGLSTWIVNLRHRTRSNKVKAHCFILLFKLTLNNRTGTRLMLVQLVNSSILHLRPCIKGIPMNRTYFFSPSLSVYYPSTHHQA